MGSTPRGTWIGAPKPSTRIRGAITNDLYTIHMFSAVRAHTLCGAARREACGVARAGARLGFGRRPPLSKAGEGLCSITPTEPAENFYDYFPL